VPPKVNSPFLTDVLVVGSKDTEIRSAGIVPWEKRSSGNMVKAPLVESTGPILWSNASARIHSDGLHTHPRTPSKPFKPVEVEPTPIDAPKTKVGLSVTMSENAWPEEGGKGFSGDDVRGERPTAEPACTLADRHQLRLDDRLKEGVIPTTPPGKGILLPVRT